MEPVWALAMVLGAIGGLRLLLRVFAAPRHGASGGSLRVQSSCALGPKQRLHVVEIDGERLLIGATDHTVQLIRPLCPEVAAKASSESLDPPLPVGRPHLARAARLLARALPLLVLAVVSVVGPDAATAQQTGTGAAAMNLPIDLEAAVEPERISDTLEIVLLLTLVSVAPSILLMATCFTRVVIVLALLRQAIGVHQLPPNQVIVGLALAITLFVMAPVGKSIKAEALDPYTTGEIGAEVALERTTAGIRGFLTRYTRENDLALFVSLSQDEKPTGPDDVALSVLLPAYMISELRTAFEIGFTMFLPFLVIDLVIASMLISMQMIVLPPIIVSLPFKLMLFVLIDGWNLVVSSLVRGLG